MSVRLRSDLYQYVREEAAARNETQAAVIEGALLRDLRVRRRERAQEAALMDADLNRQIADEMLPAGTETFGRPE